MSDLPESAVCPPIDDGPSRWNRFAEGLSRGALVTARALGLAATQVGRAAVTAYDAIDPDLRRHLGELPLAGLSMLLPSDGEISPLPDDQRRPIVCVHGLGGHPGNFIALRAWLALEGHRRVYAIAFEDGACVDAMALTLSARIDEVFEKNHLPKGSQVDVVAHSMGGLVARLALEAPGTAARVATLVTLGTPHAGSYLARLLNTAHGRALRPGSDVQSRLARQLPWATPRESPWPRLVSFYSHSDVMLLPPTSACVEGAENIELQGATHNDYLMTPAAFRRIVSKLDA